MTRWICPICKAELFRMYRLDRFGVRRPFDICKTCGELGFDAAVTDG